MRGHGQRRRDRPGHGHGHTAQLRRPGNGVASPGTGSRLHDHGAASEGRDQPVPSEETGPQRMSSRSQLRDDGTARLDLVAEPVVTGGIGLVHSRRHHGQGQASHPQRTAVGGAVDTEGQPGDHQPPGCAEIGRQLSGHVQAVAGGSTCPDNRNGPRHPQQFRVPRNPQPQRLPALVSQLAHPEVGQGVRPELVPGNEETGTAPGGCGFQRLWINALRTTPQGCGLPLSPNGLPHILGPVGLDEMG